jgi:hypothetical protein
LLVLRHRLYPSPCPSLSWLSLVLPRLFRIINQNRSTRAAPYPVQAGPHRSRVLFLIRFVRSSSASRVQHRSSTDFIGPDFEEFRFGFKRDRVPFNIGKRGTVVCLILILISERINCASGRLTGTTEAWLSLFILAWRNTSIVAVIDPLMALSFASSNSYCYNYQQ